MTTQFWFDSAFGMGLTFSFDPRRGLFQCRLTDVIENGFGDMSLHDDITRIIHSGMGRTLVGMFRHVPMSRYIFHITCLVIIQIPCQTTAFGMKGMIVIRFVLSDRKEEKVRRG